MELSLPNIVYIVDTDSSDRYSVLVVEEPSVREYTLLSELQSAHRLDYMPFSVAPKDNPHDKLHCNKLVPDKASKDVRAIHLYQLLMEVVNDTESQTIEWLSNDPHSDDYFEQTDIDGMRKAVDLVGGFDALWDLSERLTIEYITQFPKEPVPTVFVSFGYEAMCPALFIKRCTTK